MKRLLLILLIVTAGLDAFAAGHRVRGRVTDINDDALPGLYETPMHTASGVS